MRRILLFLSVLFSVLNLKAQVTLDFTQWNYLESGGKWGNSYSQRTIVYDDATVVMGAASHQTITVTDCPVMKKGTITVTFATGKSFDKVAINLKKWGTKEKTVKLAVSKDGKTFTDTGKSSSTFTLEDKLSSDVKAVQFSFTENKNQVGIASIVLGSGSEQPVDYRPVFANQTYNLTVGKTHTLELGALSCPEKS